MNADIRIRFFWNPHGFFWSGFQIFRSLVSSANILRAVWFLLLRCLAICPTVSFTACHFLPTIGEYYCCLPTCPSLWPYFLCLSHTHPVSLLGTISLSSSCCLLVFKSLDLSEPNYTYRFSIRGRRSKEHQIRIPKIYHLNKNLHCMPSSSAEMKRLLSFAGFIFNDLILPTEKKLLFVVLYCKFWVAVFLLTEEQ